MPSFVVDWGLILVLYVIALYFLGRGYHRGYRAWLVKHSIITSQASERRAIMEGYLGEAVIALFAAIAAGVVIFFTANATLTEVVARWWMWALPILVFVYVCVNRHSAGVVVAAERAGRKPAYTRQLAGAYRSYDLYSACLFGTGALILMLLLAQFLHDGAAFAAEARRIEDAFAQARSLAEGGQGDVTAYAQAMAQAEIGFSRIALSGKLLQIQFNPLFIFAGTLITINMLIRFSRLKSLFTGTAVNMTAVFTYGPLVLIGAVALVIYLTVYEVMLEEALETLRAFTPPPSLGEWQMSQRHGQMVAELSNARNIFGFGRAIGGEGGGFAILAWGVQTALEKIAEKKGDKREARMPLEKFRPDDGRKARKRETVSHVA